MLRMGCVVVLIGLAAVAEGGQAPSKDAPH